MAVMTDRVSSSIYRFKVGWLIAAAILIVFVVQGVAAVMANSQTVDEGAHFAAGYSYWATGDFRMNPEHPPLVKELCVLPVWLMFDLSFDTDSTLWRAANQYQIGFNLLYRSRTDAETLLNLARLPNLIIAGCIVALVGWWSYRLWGPGAGLLAMALAALEPTFVAHSTLLTTDAGWTLFCTATLYVAWGFCRTGSWKWLVGLGIATGLALSSKFSAVSLIGVLPAVLGCYWVMSGKTDWLGGAKSRATDELRKEGTENRRVGSALQRFCYVPHVRAVSCIVRTLLAVLALAYIAQIVVCVVYFFQDPLLWWDGLRHVLAHQKHGRPAYFWGQYSNTGWPHYFFVALGIKTQVATLVLSLASLALFSKGKALSRDGVVFLVLPLCMFLTALLLARINIGVRHALHVYPLLFILASRMATIRTTPVWGGRVAIGLLLGLSAFSAWRIAPYPVAYFNELVGGPMGGRHILSDSNLDWGQGLSALAKYVEQERLDVIYLSYFGNAPPEYYGIRYLRAPGFGPLSSPGQMQPTPEGRELFAISDFNLKGIWLGSDERYAWLAERKPIATLGRSIYVYDITNDAQAHFRLAVAYLEEHTLECAARELEKVLVLEPDHSDAKKLTASLWGFPKDSETTD